MCLIISLVSLDRVSVFSYCKQRCDLYLLSLKLQDASRWLLSGTGSDLYLSVTQMATKSCPRFVLMTPLALPAIPHGIEDKGALLNAWIPISSLQLVPWLRTDLLSLTHCVVARSHCSMAIKRSEQHSSHPSVIQLWLGPVVVKLYAWDLLLTCIFLK